MQKPIPSILSMITNEMIERNIIPKGNESKVNDIYLIDKDYDVKITFTTSNHNTPCVKITFGNIPALKRGNYLTVAVTQEFIFFRISLNEHNSRRLTFEESSRKGDIKYGSYGVKIVSTDTFDSYKAFEGFKNQTYKIGLVPNEDMGRIFHGWFYIQKHNS